MKKRFFALCLALALMSGLVTFGLISLIGKGKADEKAEDPQTVIGHESRYSTVAMDEESRELMAQVIYLEARGESQKGQQAVAEVILNRVLSDGFPDNIIEVLWEEGQFSVMRYISEADPGEEQYAAIDAALYGDPVLDADVVFFDAYPENERVFCVIGSHVFCREYIWE